MSAIATPAPEPIAIHVPCARCGYDLFGAERTGLCPECGRDVAFSLSGVELLSDGETHRTVRQMGGAFLTSSIFAGLCPASCLLLLQMEHAVGAMLMSAAFGLCVGFAARGEMLRRQLRGTAAGAVLSGSPLGADLVAALGLGLVNGSAYLYAIQEMDAFGFGFTPGIEITAMALVGVGFFLLNVTAWRALPAWRAQAHVASLLHARGTLRLMVFLAWTKAIYETLWLFCCWSPFALMSLGDRRLEELAIPLAVGALFGLFGFGVIWVLMIIAHASLLVQIRRATRFAAT
jgi:hypothetical protein